jgi:hypothetical protein
LAHHAAYLGVLGFAFLPLTFAIVLSIGDSPCLGLNEAGAYLSTGRLNADLRPTG